MVTRSAAVLTAAGVESVRTLFELQKSPNAPATRLQAAKAVLELGVKLRQLAEPEGLLEGMGERLREAHARRLDVLHAPATAALTGGAGVSLRRLRAGVERGPGRLGSGRVADRLRDRFVINAFIAHPTIRRVNRFSMTAKSTRPAHVPTKVMSAHYARSRRPN